MKPAHFILWLLFAVISIQVSAQTDTSTNGQPQYGHRDSLYLAKMNYTSNLMIGGGVGLVCAGSFLVYEGVKIYNTNVTGPNPPSTTAQNHSQGTGYFAGAGIAYVGAAVLIALGVRNKLDFKRRQKRLSLQSGLLDSGNLGAMLSF